MNEERTPMTWDERYAAEEYLYGRQPNDFLREMSSLIPVGGRVLCLADGEGRNGTFLATTGRVVSSIDQSARGVEKARALAAGCGVELDARVGDLATEDLGDATWDAIVSIFVHLPTEVRRSLHTRVVRALKPGGLFILEAYTPSQIGRGTGGPPVSELAMTLQDVRSELDGLVEEHGVECIRSIVEGDGHTGDGAVVQYVGRRPAH